MNTMRVLRHAHEEGISHRDILQKVREIELEAKDRDRKMQRRAREHSFRLAILTQKVKVLYTMITTLVVLLAGDLAARLLIK